MSSRDAMMSIKHPANLQFSLFHSIDQHWKDNCYVITCLKSVDLLAHAMTAVLLPYIKWMLEAKYGKVAQSQVPSGSNQQHGIEQQICIGIPKKSVFTTKALRC